MIHNLDSLFLYVHPLLALMGYMFIITTFIAITVETRRGVTTGLSRKSLHLAWLFNFTGLLSGMMWAHVAWGTYWSWDPKETATLILFSLVVEAAGDPERGAII